MKIIICLLIVVLINTWVQAKSIRAERWDAQRGLSWLCNKYRGVCVCIYIYGWRDVFMLTITRIEKLNHH